MWAIWRPKPSLEKTQRVAVGDDALAKNSVQKVQRVSFVVCAFAPSCWKIMRLKPHRLRIFGITCLFRSSRYCGPVTVLSVKNGPMIPLALSAAQTVTHFGCNSVVLSTCGSSSLQIRQFYLFTWPDNQKCASSLNQIWGKALGWSARYARKFSANASLRCLKNDVNVWSICILYG